jgi:lipopolysaccharide export system protein LptC
VSVELHLPDLPEVPISLGAEPGRPRPTRPWPARLRDTLSSSLPLLLMVALALATWWLVSNSPRPPATAVERPLSKDPDYTMTAFSLDRFDAAGRLKLRLEGDQLRHYPSTDRIEIDGVRIRAVTPDGRETQARAARAIGNGDGSEMQLLGGAEVTSVDAAGAPVVMRGEFLHAFFVTERVKSHLPVQLHSAGVEMRAAGMDYDHAAQRLELAGPMRFVMSPRVPASGARR